MESSAMIFRIFGEIVATIGMPLLLTAVGSFFYKGYAPFCAAQTEMHIQDASLALLLGLATCSVSYRIGAATPDLRRTPRALLSYVLRLLRLFILVGLFSIVLHFGLLMAVKSFAPHSQWSMWLTLGVAILFALIFEAAARAAFVEDSTLDVPRKPVRGQELDAGETISGRAWLDE